MAKNESLSDKLKPCPFCGGEEILQGLSEVEEGRYWYYRYCLACHSKTNSQVTKAKAIKAWNTRQPDLEAETTKIACDMLGEANKCFETASEQLSGALQDYSEVQAKLEQADAEIKRLKEFEKAVKARHNGKEKIMASKFTSN